MCGCYIKLIDIRKETRFQDGQERKDENNWEVAGAIEIKVER